jgi:glycerol-3-phosphate acyltransferase PlsY
VYFGFKGGKGVSTSFGVILCLDWRIALILGAVELIMIATVKIVSVSSLTVFLLLPIVTFFLNSGAYYSNVVVMLFLAILVFWRHRSNIQRLLNGTENKFGKK